MDRIEEINNHIYVGFEEGQFDNSPMSMSSVHLYQPKKPYRPCLTAGCINQGMKAIEVYTLYFSGYTHTIVIKKDSEYGRKIQEYKKIDFEGAWKGLMLMAFELYPVQHIPNIFHMWYVASFSSGEYNAQKKIREALGIQE